MMPIPKRLLIHKVLLKEPNEIDVWQDSTYTDIHLSFVRLEPYGKVVILKDNTQRQLTSTMIYDCTHSRPQGITFMPQQKIVHRNTEYTIETVEHLYDDSKLHHIELGLV